MEIILSVLVGAAFGFVACKLTTKKPVQPAAPKTKSKGGASSSSEDLSQYYKGTRNAK
jgi:hypothetical protein